MGIPADADDTACALAALALHGAEDDIQQGATLLRTFWRQDGGPFKTWRGTGIWEGRNRDDPVVNCNVIFALACLGEAASRSELGAVGNLVTKSVHGSRYYVSPAAVCYAARRAALPLDTLPAIAATRPLMEDLLGCVQWLAGTQINDQDMIDAIIAVQRVDGTWPGRPWCTGYFKSPHYWGSVAVSTALTVEALGSFESGPQA